MIRALVCDFGGVLTSPIEEGFHAYEKASGVTLEQLGMAMARAMEEHGEHPLFALERGEISEEEFGQRLAAQLDSGFDAKRLRDLYFEQLRPNRPMIDFVAELRERGLRTALCTNNVREWEPHWRSMLPELDDVFEVVVDSGFVGTRKPERRIYELTMERLGDGLRFEDCLFVDDLEHNCEAARQLGMSAVRFQDAQQAIAEINALLG
ncbi:MAG TPA: HAD family phosphatase [Thermoleophilaceae bacterium]